VLRETRNVRQIPGESPRRWFSDDFFDLIVWYSPRSDIEGFQLCYQKGRDEKALTWFKDAGFSHNRIDNGEGRPGRHKMTPILTPDGLFDKDHILGLFRKESTEIDFTIASFVSEKMMEYPTDHGGGGDWV
jgi:hypothetical protein